MKLNKKWLFILLIPLLTGCAAAFSVNQTVNGNSWYPVSMKPSQISLDGRIIYSNQFTDNELIEVYYNETLVVDGSYYYNQLYKSYGWTPTSGGEFIGSQYSAIPSRSTLHISVKRGVAIYLYPDDHFTIFGIRQVKSLH